MLAPVGVELTLENKEEKLLGAGRSTEPTVLKALPGASCFVSFSLDSGIRHT